MTQVEEPHNGVAIPEPEPVVVRVPPVPLARLRRMQAEAAGAAAAAQAAIDVANQLQGKLQVALTEACEDQGLHLAPDQNRPVDVDWMTGQVTVR